MSSAETEDMIACHNRSAGCKWSGTYAELAGHLKTGCTVNFARCEKCGEPKATAATPDSASCQCNAQSSRMQCPFCPELLNRGEVTAHIQQCRITTEVCADCGAHVARAQLRNHKTEDCGATLVPCPFSTPGFHRRQAREAAKLNKLTESKQSSTQGDPDDDDDNYDDEEDDEDDQLAGLCGCEHALLRRDEVRTHITQKAEAHLGYAVAALKAHRSCLEATRLDLEDEKEARQRFQSRSIALEARVRDLEEELAVLRQKLVNYTAQHPDMSDGDEALHGDSDEADDDDDVDLDADESVVQDEMAKVATLLWSAQPSATSVASSQTSEARTPEEARKRILATLPPRKRMLANLLLQAQRQHVQEVVCAPNAHDDIARAARAGRRFYSRSELLSLRRSVMDSLAKRDNYPDVGAAIYVDVQENRAAAQSASTSTTEGAAAIALARLRKNKQQLLQQSGLLKSKTPQSQKKNMAPIVMGAALNGGLGIGKGLNPALANEPLSKPWLKKSGGGGRKGGMSGETPIEVHRPVLVDHLGKPVSAEKLQAGLARASKPWVPRSQQASPTPATAQLTPTVSIPTSIPQSTDPGVSTELSAEEVIASQEATRILRGMLNKVTAANVETFANKLWMNALGPLTRVEQAEPPIETLFEKAVAEAGFAGLYAQLVKALVRHPDAHPFTQIVPTPENPAAKVQRTLHWILISRCRREFEAAFKNQMDLVHTSTTTTQTAAGAGETASGIDADITKRRLIGVLRFLGELYKNEQLLDVIMFACVDRLLDVVTALVPASTSQSTSISKEQQAKIEILIDEITTLLNNILPNMVLATSPKSQLPAAKRDELSTVLRGQKNRLMALADNPALTKRAKILLLNLFDK